MGSFGFSTLSSHSAMSLFISSRLMAQKHKNSKAGSGMWWSPLLSGLHLDPEVDKLGEQNFRKACKVTRGSDY